MTEIEKGFFPLTEVQDENIEGIRISLNLPEWIDQDRIGVSLRGIYKMCQMGGIETIKILGSTDGEVSTYTPNLVGINPDGAGIAGKVGLKTEAPLFSSSKDISGNALPASYSWINATIDVNLREIDCRISERKDKSLRSAANWTKYLNQALQGGIAKEGTRHLIKDIPLTDKVRMAFAPGITLAINFDLLRDPPTGPIIFAAIVEGCYLGYQFLDRLHYHSLNKKQRLSLICGPQIDRALALKIMSKTERLIKELKNTGRGIRLTNKE